MKVLAWYSFIFYGIIIIMALFDKGVKMPTEKKTFLLEIAINYPFIFLLCVVLPFFFFPVSCPAVQFLSSFPLQRISAGRATAGLTLIGDALKCFCLQNIERHTRAGRGLVSRFFSSLKNCQRNLIEIGQLYLFCCLPETGLQA